MAAAAAEAKPKRRRGRQGKQDDITKNASSTVRSNSSDKKAKAVTTTGHKSLLISLVDTTWYDYCHDTPGRNATITTNPPEKGQSNHQTLIIKFKTKADNIMKDELSLLTTSKDEKWVESTMKKGTLKDRIAAMSVLVSTNPVHKIFALDQLLDLAVNQSNSRVAQLAAEALEDLFLNNLLVPTRKLIAMHQRPLYLYDTNTNTTLSPRVLLLWRFEDLLLEKYNSFLRGYLQATLKDGMDLSKLFSLRCASRLLRGAPQGEAVLLQLLVNKLGDPSKKTAAAAGHELRKVLDQHPNMQTVIAREVQQLAHRPALSPKALYNCIIFLNQLQLSTHDKALPTSLIATYFRLFDVATKERDVLQGRLLGALLSGVNRAHPFLQDNDEALRTHMDALYRIVHTAPPSASTQALLLLFHVAVGNTQTTAEAPPSTARNAIKKGATVTTTAKTTKTDTKDRFYRALYSKLIHISNGKHLTIFFNLLYKSMKYDTNVTRVLVFCKRLLCTCMHGTAPVLAASLFLVHEILKLHPALLPCLTTVLEGPPTTWDANQREPALAAPKMGDDSNQELVTTGIGLWENPLLQHHVHPSVSKFAQTLGGTMNYQGDPLKDFALGPFLDKFAYKNPKKEAAAKTSGSIAERRSEGQKEQQAPLPVNDPSFLKQKSVGDEDVFFQHFFQERARRDNLKGVVRHKGEVDEEDRYKEKRRNEDQAFDTAEGFDADHTKLFEEGWETDPEEEEFVDQLAEKLMEEHAATTGGEAVNYDDEDPDMEGWDDINDDDVDIEDDIEDEDADESSEGVELVGDDVEDDDEDDENAGPIHISEMFTDSDDNEEDDDKEFEEDSSDEERDGGTNPDDDDFMEADNDSDSDEMPDFEGQDVSDDSDEAGGNDIDSDDDPDFDGKGGDKDCDDEDDDGDDDNITAFAAEDSEDDDEVEQLPKKKSKGKKGDDEVVFADASEYEEMIAKAYTKQLPSIEGNDQSDGDILEPSVGSGKKRKRRKKKS